jgi:hypothetical protein
MSLITRTSLSLGLLTLVVTGCASAAPPADISPQLTQAVQTAFASIRETQTAAVPAPSATSAATPIAPRTPPGLPATFVAASLNPLDAPHTYIQDTCQYLRAKWSSANSAPGTIVMAVMFHSISKAQATDANQISAENFNKLMKDLHDLGFTAINMQQLSAFLYSNAFIPQRSVVLIVDDRHFAEYFTDHFQPYYEKWGWPVVNSYIAKDERPDLWQQNAELSAAGWVDYQAHGVIHNIPITSSSTDEYITSELQGAIANLQKYFDKTPIAYIWPGGGFTPHAAAMARQFGYKLGFTVNPRGPLMFNWIPIADQPDPARPYFIDEGTVNDPLMVLPRYWDVNARSYLDAVRQIGNDAGAYAERNKAIELEYYDIVCAPSAGAIP